MIFRERASVVLVDQGKLLAVALEDTVTKTTRLFLPGGGLEAGETPAQAAVRETLEETGYAVVVDSGRVSRRRYPFVWNDKTYDCLTHFFPARLQSGKTPQAVNDVDYHRGVVWVPLAEVSRHFAFEPVILAEVEQLIQ